jgi:hypothetical protein
MERKPAIDGDEQCDNGCYPHPKIKGGSMNPEHMLSQPRGIYIASGMNQ